MVESRHVLLELMKSELGQAASSNLSTTPLKMVDNWLEHAVPVDWWRTVRRML